MTLVLVSLFGGVGCVIRFLLEYAVRRHHPTIRPWATVVTNAVGCGLAGFTAYHFTATGDAHLRSVVLTGLCGGLTTFSSAFAVPAVLQREHHVGYSLALIFTTPVACVALFLVGVGVAH